MGDILNRVLQQHDEGKRPQDPDIRRLYKNRCDTGAYLIIRNNKVEGREVDFVTAEIEAHAQARTHPGLRIVVAKAVLEVEGVPHVYEVHPKT